MSTLTLNFYIGQINKHNKVKKIKFHFIIVHSLAENRCGWHSPTLLS